MGTHKNGNYPPNGYADRCNNDDEAIAFERSKPSQYEELHNQRVLVPTGDTVSLDMKNDEIR